jgi:hypothetical protein
MTSSLLLHLLRELININFLYKDGYIYVLLRKEFFLTILKTVTGYRFHSISTTSLSQGGEIKIRIAL